MKKNLKGFFGTVEEKKIEDSQSTKRITQIHVADNLIDRQIAVLCEIVNLSLRAASRCKQ